MPAKRIFGPGSPTAPESGVDRFSYFRRSESRESPVGWMRSVFHLTLRATEGFLRSFVAHLLEWEIAGAGLYHPLQARQAPGGFLGQESCWALASGPGQHRAESLWGGRMEGAVSHGYTNSPGRTWRKLHLSVDSETQEIEQAKVVLSEASLERCAGAGARQLLRPEHRVSGADEW